MKNKTRCSYRLVAPSGASGSRAVIKRYDATRTYLSDKNATAY